MVNIKKWWKEFRPESYWSTCLYGLIASWFLYLCTILLDSLPNEILSSSSNIITLFAVSYLFLGSIAIGLSILNLLIGIPLILFKKITSDHFVIISFTCLLGICTFFLFLNSGALAH